jgi:hypothetical protein
MEPSGSTIHGSWRACCGGAPRAADCAEVGEVGSWVREVGDDTTEELRQEVRPSNRRRRRDRCSIRRHRRRELPTQDFRLIDCKFGTVVVPIAAARTRNEFDAFKDYLPSWDSDWNSVLFVWLISHQPAVLFSQNKPATNNQPKVIFSQNKSAPAISHPPNEQAVQSLASIRFLFISQNLT